MLKCENRSKHYLLVIVAKKPKDGWEALVGECSIWNADLPENVCGPRALGRIGRATQS